MRRYLLLALLPLYLTAGPNQTDTLSPVLPQDTLPFTLEIETASFTLPSGIQAFSSAIYDDKWIFVTGRSNGLHGFANIGNNFPPNFQNTTIYVIDPSTGNSWSRSLTEQSSGLNQEQIDTLSVTAPQYYQKGRTLYIVGGYGINTATGEMETKSTLTAIDLKRTLEWVISGQSPKSPLIRQTSDPLLQVTGGFLFQANDHQPFLLMLGQNFAGLYRDGSNGIYTEQIRRFWVNDNGKKISILPDNSTTSYHDYRRRDLNILPILRHNQPAYVAFAGVFTLEGGIWTVPITIFPNGSSYQPDPNSPDTFKQAMNQYNCASFGLYSTCSQEMFAIFPGGLSLGYFSNGTFTTDSEIPFINQVTTIKIDRDDHYTQYIMDNEYPYIVSTGSNPGNQLYFGTEAQFFPAKGVALFNNGVIQMDALPKVPTLIGYIAGGIMSTKMNTDFITDSTSSPYVFKVIYSPTTP